MAWLGKGEVWTEKDYLLTLAYTEYLEGMHSCGYPRHICQHEENAGGWFTTKEVTCYATEAVEIETSAEGYKPQPGVSLVAVYERDHKQDPLPDLRGVAEHN
jgi:hypothetical protein